MRPARFLLAALVLGPLAGCDPAAPGPDDDGTPGTVNFSPVTPPLYTSTGGPSDLRGVLLEARGDLVIYGRWGEHFSLDGGRTWRTRTDAGSGWLAHARVVDEQTIVTVAGDRALRYDTGTDAWSVLTTAPPGPVRTSAWAYDDGDIYVAHATVDTIYRWRDGAWTALDLGTVAPNGLTEAYDIEIGPDGTLYVATQSGLYVSADDGATWDWRFQNRYLYETVQYAPGRLILVAPHEVFATDDGGQTFREVTLPSAYSRDGQGMRSDVAGRLCLSAHCSTDGGRTWEEVFRARLPSGFLARYLGDRAYIVADDAGFFTADDPVRTLTYRGGFGAPADPGPASKLTGLGTFGVFPDGGFILRAAPAGGRQFPARYDATSGTWHWTSATDVTGDRARLVLGVTARLRDGRLAVSLSNLIWFSSDDGHTWDAPVSVWPSFQPGPILSPHLPGGIFEASDGTLYVAGGWRRCTASGDCTPLARLSKSVDGGRTWSELRDDTGANELRPVAVAGTAVFVEDQVSSDGGLSWESSGVSVPLAGTPSGGLLHLDGQVLTLRSPGGADRALGTVTVEGMPLATGIRWTIGAVDEQGYAYAVCDGPTGSQRVCKSDRPLR